MQKLGQHFLKNKKVLDTIVAALEIGAGERIIEIGPGHGELTAPLVRAVEKIGSPSDVGVTSIEKDHALIPDLMALVKKDGTGRLTIIEGDALKLLPDVVRDLPSSTRKSPAQYKIAGNIPYYITGKLLRIISELDEKPERTVLMIQKEVAERICAAPPAMNRLAASVQFWADAEIVAVVPRKDFSPPPEVDSAVIVLAAKNSATGAGDGAVARRAPMMDEARYYETVRAIFSQPRKTLLNNISAMSAGEKRGTQGERKAIVAARLRDLGIDPGARPQDLDVPQIIAIAKAALWG